MDKLKDATKIAENLERKIYVSHNEAATFLGITPRTLYKWCFQRKITYYKSGKLNLFKPQELTSFIESNKVISIDQLDTQAREYVLIQKRA
jgi:excisionase family DNA binding protein